MPFEFDCIGLLDIGVKAHLRTFNGTGLDADKIAVVYYDVPLGAGGGCIDWLKANRKTVKDVQIDFQTLSGTWRSAGIVSEQSTKNKEAVTIVQTFKYGWIQSLLSGGAVDWSEARYVRGNESATPTVLGSYPVTDPELNPQQYHLVKWDGIDPLKLDTVRSELRDLTPSAWSPTVNGESLGSGFFLLDVIAETSDGQDQDRSGTITALIAKPRFSLQAWQNYGTPAQAKVYYLYDVPMYLSQSIINQYNKRTGASASAGAPNERFLLNIQVTDKLDESSTDKNITLRSCAVWAVTTYYHNVAAMVAAPANAMGITYSARFDLNLQTGLYSGTIEKRVRQTQKTGPYRGTNTHGQTVNVTEWTGLHVSGTDYKEATLSISAGDIVVSLGSAITLPSNTITKGNTWQVSKRTNDDCTVDVTAQERAELAIDDLTYTAQDSAASNTEVLEKFNQLAPVTLTAGVNEVLRADVRYNKETGLMDIVKQTTASKELEGDEVQESGAQKQTVTRKTNTATELDTPAPEAGKIKTVTRQETEFDGRKNTTESIVESKTQTATGGQARADQTSVVETETQAVAEVAATPVAGKVVVVDNRPTEFSRFATRKETITPVNQPNTEGSASAAQVSVVTKATQAEAEALATPEPGKVVRVSNQSTEFGKVRTVKEVITPTDQTGEGAVVRWDQTSATETHTQADAPADDAAIAGKIVQADSRPTEFGKYATQKTVVTPIDQTGTGHTDSHSEDVTETRHTQAAAVLTAPVAAVGEIKEVSSQPTEFGMWQTTERTRTAEDQESVDQSAEHRSTAEVTKHTHKVAQEVAGTPAAGQQISVSNRPTPFGDFETAKQIDTAIELTGTDYDKTGLSETEIDKTWSGNKLVGAPTRGAGTAVTRVQTPTPFKDKWDITEATETGTPWDTDWEEYDSRNGTEAVRRWGNQTEAFGEAIAAGLTDVTNNGFSHQLNRFGLWDGVATKTTPSGGGAGTFWRNTQTLTYAEENEYRERTYKDENKVEFKEDQGRTVDITHTSVIVQDYGTADDTWRQYKNDAPPTGYKLRRGFPKIHPLSDQGRTGFLVEVEYVKYSAWSAGNTP